MYCSNCGRAIKDTDLYCSVCGHKVGNDEKRHDTVAEEVIYNPPQTDKEPIMFGRKDQPIYNIVDPEGDKPKSCESDFDFVWNVHKFPSAAPREIEDINFDWNPKIEEARSSQFTSGETDNSTAGFSSFTSEESKEKFNTYNKSREEFQKLLDREYVRLNQKPPGVEATQSTSVRTETTYNAPAQNETAPVFDPIRHLQEMELERKRERDLFYAELEHQQENEVGDSDLDDGGRRFDTRELQKDLLQVEMDDVAKTQIIERIKYGTSDYEGPGDFDIKKTQYYQKPEQTSQAESFEYGRPEVQFELQPESKTVEVPIIPPDSNFSAETPVYTEQSAAAPVEQAAPILPQQAAPTGEVNMQERLKHLWDSDTAPIPVQSIPAQVAAAYGEDKSAKPQGNASSAKEGKSGGGKLIRFFIVLIIIVLLIEGTVLGLRYFAPDSQATKKINYSITLVQDWIKTTFSGTADNSAAN